MISGKLPHIKIQTYWWQRVVHEEQDDTICLVPKFRSYVLWPSENCLKRFSIERSSPVFHHFFKGINGTQTFVNLLREGIIVPYEHLKACGGNRKRLNTQYCFKITTIYGFSDVHVNWDRIKFDITDKGTCQSWFWLIPVSSWKLNKNKLCFSHV